MSLLWIDGFDSQTAALTGTYAGGILAFGYTTGRFGTGTALSHSGGVGGGSYMPVTFASAQTTIYAGIAINNQSAYNSESALFGFVNAGTGVLQLRVNATNQASPGAVRVVRGAPTATGTVLGTSATTVSPGVWTYIEMKLVTGTGTSGSFIVRQNGVETLNVTGIDTGSASITAIALDTRCVTQGGWGAWMDDWYVCNGSGSVNNNFLGDLRILTLVPVAAGSSTQLAPSTGSNWQCVDEIPPVATDYVGSAGIGFKDLYDMTALGSGYTNIKGVKTTAYAFSSDAGTIKGRSTVKSGSSFANSADNTLSPTPQMFTGVVENDPATGAAWTNATLNAAEFGWEVRS